MAFWDEPVRPRPKFTDREKTLLWNEQKGVCNGCGLKFAKQNMTVDHILPISRGGTERMTNLQMLCGNCNSVKNDGTMGDLRRRLRQKGITPKSAPPKPKPAKRVPAKRKPVRKKRDPIEKFFDDLFRF